MLHSGGTPLPSKAATDLSSALTQAGRKDIAEQMLRVVVPRQTLSGEGSSFSFLAHPWPRLSYEQRCATSIRECESLVVTLQDATFEIDLDDFGQVNWLKVKGAPALFQALSELLQEGASS